MLPIQPSTEPHCSAFDYQLVASSSLSVRRADVVLAHRLAEGRLPHAAVPVMAAVLVAHSLCTCPRGGSLHAAAVQIMVADVCPLWRSPTALRRVWVKEAAICGVLEHEVCPASWLLHV